MNFVVTSVVMGIIATIGMDLWALVVKHLLRLPTTHWALVGRWFGHMPAGVFIHRPIAESPPIPHERAIGWVAHYSTGILYGLIYMSIVRGLFHSEPSLESALAFGLVTLAAPWLLMQPAMGVGIFARNAPKPGVMRAVNVSMHAVFGTSLFGGWLLIR